MRRVLPVLLVLLVASARAADAPPKDEPLEALKQPLTPEERELVRELAVLLDSSRPGVRGRARAAIRELGVRAAPELVAVSGEASTANVRFAARSLAASLVLEHYLDRSQGRPSWLGVQFTPSSTARHAVSIQVKTPLAGEPADRAGVLAGDEIVAIDGVPFLSDEDFMTRVRGTLPGSEVELTIERGDEVIKLTAKLVTRHDEDGHALVSEPELLRRRALERWAKWLKAARAPR